MKQPIVKCNNTQSSLTAYYYLMALLNEYKKTGT